MKLFNAIEYLAIDIANNFGDDVATGFKGDKDTFENRIAWVKANQDVLESRIKEAEEPLLYAKAVGAFRKALKGLPIGHTVALDSVCSGIQIMSVITGCMEGCRITGLIEPDVRYDAYTEITKRLNELLGKDVSVTRKQSKDAIMPAMYGSQASPRRVFGEELLPAFFQACEDKAEGAFQLLEILRDSWNPDRDHHSWTLPDGHLAYVPVMNKVETRLKIEEFGYTMNAEYFEQGPSEYGISNIANVVHSIDAYILRSLVRRCNYIPAQIQAAADIIQVELMGRQLGQRKQRIWRDLKWYRLYRDNRITDISIVNELNAEVANALDLKHLLKLNQVFSQMLEYEPFEVVTIHDS